LIVVTLNRIRRGLKAIQRVFVLTRNTVAYIVVFARDPIRHVINALSDLVSNGGPHFWLGEEKP
jgi:hypothetical protein